MKDTFKKISEIMDKYDVTKHLLQTMLVSACLLAVAGWAYNRYAAPKLAAVGINDVGYVHYQDGLYLDGTYIPLGTAPYGEVEDLFELDSKRRVLLAGQTLNVLATYKNTWKKVDLYLDIRNPYDQSVDISNCYINSVNATWKDDKDGLLYYMKDDKKICVGDDIDKVTGLLGNPTRAYETSNTLYIEYGTYLYDKEVLTIKAEGDNVIAIEVNGYHREIDVEKLKNYNNSAL